MELSVFIYILILFNFLCFTDQKLYLPSSVLQTNSTNTDDDCLKSALLQYRAQHVRLMCGSKATYCPSTIVNKNRAMSWMFFDRKTPVGAVDRRDFCVMAGDNVSHLHDLFTSNHTCSRGNKTVLVFPSAGFRAIPALERLFSVAWKAGTTDIVIILSDSLCRVFTYVPIRQQSRRQCPDLTPVQVTSWAEDSAPINNSSSVTYFPENKISNLHLCEVKVLVWRANWVYWTPLINFLEVAMNATFNLTLTDTHPNVFRKLRPSQIQVNPFLVHEYLAVKYIIAAYLFYDEKIFAVPSILTSSFEWFRLSGELSDYVWYGLIITLAMTTAVSYFLIQADQDFGFVILFVLQPLFGAPRRGDFLKWRGRIFFINWLMFCFVLQSSYLCALLRELAVPSTADELKSLDDLLKTALPIHVAFDIDAWNLPFDPAQTKALMRRIHKHVGLYPSEMVKKDRNDIAYIVPRDMFARYFLNMPYRVLPGASITAITAPFRLNRPSPYERFFDIAFMRAMGAGALDKVSRNRHLYDYLKTIRLGSRVETGPKPFSLKNFGVFFSVWFIGCVLSFVSFVVEICLNCTLSIASSSLPPPTERLIHITHHQ